MREVDRLDLGSVFNLHYASNPTVMQISGPHYTPRPPSHPFQDMVSVSTPLGAEAGLGSGRCWPCAGRLARWGGYARLGGARGLRRDTVRRSLPGPLRGPHLALSSVCRPERRAAAADLPQRCR